MKIDSRHYNVMKGLIDGLTQDQICEKYGYKKRTIQSWISDDEFQREYRKLLSDIYLNLSGEALSIVAELMRTSSNQMVKLKACQDILSRAGFDAKQMKEVKLDTDNIINLTIGHESVSDTT